jgi:hypothetical protein
MAVFIEGKEMSPCICSKVKYALGLKHIRPNNKKQCTQEYWNKIVDYFGKLESKNKEEIESAKQKLFLFQKKSSEGTE